MQNPLDVAEQFMAGVEGAGEGAEAPVEAAEIDAGEAILTINKLVPRRPRVDIFGHAYRMVLLPELHSLHRVQVANAWRDTRDILMKMSPRKEGAGKDTRIVRPRIETADVETLAEGYRLIVMTALPDLPAEVFAEMTDGDCEDVAQAFFAQSGKIPARGEPPRSITPSSSPSSPSSTRGSRRRTGSKSPPTS